MKESRFIELLNLYVDQEISPSEAVELEAEIATKPDRRRTYEQYCRMQRGCSLFFEAVRAHASEYRELSRADHAAERKVLDFPVDRPVRRRLLSSFAAAWGGGLAAAAAVIALVVLREPGAAQGGENAPIATNTAAAESAPPVEAAPVLAPPNRPTHYQFAAQFARSPDQVTERIPQGEQPDFQWMNRVQFTAVPKLSPEDLRFVDEQQTLRPSTSLQASAAAYTPGEAINAFEFRR